MSLILIGILSFVFVVNGSINSEHQTSLLTEVLKGNYAQESTPELNVRYIRQTLNKGSIGTCTTRSGETGQCRPMAHCRIADATNNVWRILNQLCVLNSNEVGVCCTPSMQGQLISPFVDHQGTVSRQNERTCGVLTTPSETDPNTPLSAAHSWPWMAVLLRVGWPHVWCGGVLITERHVLSAAHCVHKMALSEMYVRLGEYNTHIFNETRARDFKMENIKTHEDFDPLTYYNDIAIIRLDRSAFFNTYIWPVCMPPIKEQWAGKLGVVTGWGSQTFGGKFSDLLQQVLLPIWNQEQCRNALMERIPDTVLCAGLPSGGQDSCQGDSGGPLMHELPNNRWTVLGIVSWGIRCGEVNRPGVYTRVDKYLDWILQNSFI